MLTQMLQATKHGRRYNAEMKEIQNNTTTTLS